MDTITHVTIQGTGASIWKYMYSYAASVTVVVNCYRRNADTCMYAVPTLRVLRQTSCCLSSSSPFKSVIMDCVP